MLIFAPPASPTPARQGRRMVTNQRAAPPGEPPAEDNVLSRYSGSGPEAAGPTWRRQALTAGAVLLGILLVVGLWLNRSGGKALDAMAPAQRAAFYRESRESFQKECLQTLGALSANPTCRQRAEFLLLFPECDAACRQAVAPALPAPAK